MPRPLPATPVLMYHKVGAPVCSRQDAFLNVSAEGFRRQIRTLARLGYQARPFAEIVEAIVCHQSLPPRVFAATFDDGYQCIGDFAAPILAEFGFPATVFVVSQGAGKTNSWDVPHGNQELPLMDWDRLRELKRENWEIGGHTRTHPKLDMLDDAAALLDIQRGKEEAEAEIGERLRTFCYPFGYFNAATPALVRAAGFMGSCTTRSGLVSGRHDPYLLPRIKVAYRDGLTGLLYRLLVRPSLPNTRPFRRSHRQRLPERSLP